MTHRLALEYGLRPYRAELPAGSRILRAPTPAEPPPPLEDLLRQALDHPIAADRLEMQAARAGQVLLVVSDATRGEPRSTLAGAVLERIPAAIPVDLAVASGTHGPADLDALGLGEDVRRRIRTVVNHDAHRQEDLVSVGTTRRGTPVEVNRAVVEAGLVVAAGCIIPHYFAGFGAGIKAVFPGLGGNRSVRINHQLKLERDARAGVVDGNPCREDLEEVIGMLPAPPFLLNAVLDDDGAARAAVAGDAVAAFRAGAALCDPLYRVRAEAGPVVVVSGRHPSTASLYQASKLVAAGAPLLTDGGTVVLVAECSAGVGPLEVVNQGIYEIGIRPRLPANHRVVLVSSLSREVVAPTYCEWAGSLEEVLAEVGAPPLVLPRAGTLLCEAA